MKRTQPSLREVRVGAELAVEQARCRAGGLDSMTQYHRYVLIPQFIEMI